MLFLIFKTLLLNDDQIMMNYAIEVDTVCIVLKLPAKKIYNSNTNS